MERQPRLDNAETILEGVDGGGRPSPAPERIGAYRLEGRLGIGGMGEVFLAWDERLERRVAIKRIRQNAGLSPEQRERFRREARLAARLSHPAVVQIHDLISDGPDDAIVMELLEGRTVEERLAAGRLETAEVLRLALEIAEGLAAAHEAGLVHRDLKAANVIITRSGHAKILDFGLARPVVRSPEDQGFTRQGVVLGTCHAMSPEQARGEEVDERSDLFSFGALVHEMLTGRPPFRGNDPFDSLRRVVTEEPVDVCLARPDLPPEAVRLLRRLLAKNRDDRPSSAREVIEILERLRTAPSGSQAVVAPEESVSDFATGGATALELPVRFHGEAGGARKVGWTRRRMLLVGAVVLLVLAGATTLLLAIRSTRPPRVVVLPPEASPQDPELDHAASAVETAALQALGSLEKIRPIDSSAVRRKDGSNAQKAESVSADQILTFTLKREGGTAVVSFRRIDVDSDESLWAEQEDVPLRREYRRILADTVIATVQEGFSDHVRRREALEQEVQNEDYAAFLDILEQVDTGNARREDLTRLEKIFHTSPHFLEARILAARIAHSLYLLRREPADLIRAAEFAQQAWLRAPEDPRTLRQEFQITLTRDLHGEAKAILGKLDELDPGNPDNLLLHADLAEKQGNLDKAASLLAEAVEQAPSWQNRYRLAFLEARGGRIEAAREQINAILEQSPDNTWAQEARGNLELNYGGNLGEAETIYRNLLDSIPKERALGNLASIRVLRGDYAGAADIYRQALEVNPDSAYALFNLAEVETELGEERLAEEHYSQALDRLRKSEADADLPPASVLLMAQCLARLGRIEEAVAIARKELSKNPGDPEPLAQSTLVYTLAEEWDLAIANAKTALEKGYQPRNFTGSALRWLHDVEELDPWFQKTD